MLASVPVLEAELSVPSAPSSHGDPRMCSLRLPRDLCTSPPVGRSTAPISGWDGGALDENENVFYSWSRSPAAWRATSCSWKGPPMEFGVFAQLFVPRYERDVDPMAEHKRIMRNLEIGVAADRNRHQVRLVPRAPLPRRVQPHARARGVPVQPGRPHRARARGLGHLQRDPAGQQAGAGGRDGGAARPHHRGSLRVRQRPRLVDHRGVRLRHRRPRRDLEDVGRGHPRDPEDVEGRRVLLRGHLLPRAAAPGVPQALRRRAIRRCGWPPAALRRSPRPARWASGPSASPTARRTRSPR